MTTATTAENDRLWREQWDDTARFGPAYRHRRRIVAKLVRGLPHSRVMDVGCGDGALLKALSHTISGVLSGVDISEHALEQAQRQNPGCLFHVVNLEGDFDIEEQDVVVLSEVLEHLVHDEAVLRNVAKNTRYVVISVPGGPSDKVDQRYGHVRNYSGDLLRRRMESCGFDVEYLRRWGWPFFDWVQTISDRNIGMTATRGTYGTARKFISGLLYLIYFMNVLPFGRQIFAVGRRRAPAESKAPAV